MRTKYNWKSINESFFDDIDNDINSDNIIGNATMTKLYGPNEITDCTNSEDFTTFLINNIHIQEIWDIFWDHKAEMMQQIKNDHGIKHFSIAPPKLGKYKKYLKFDTIYSISVNKNIIKFEKSMNPTIKLGIHFSNFSLDSLSIDIYCD